ncbi:Clp protease (plasmid) [Piscirickettsia salmonis]|uniref:ATP-dependent Clp protease proteolytic subunit n=1 Tax=Piscirickettsia salmonis TaxID=1238 RepID=UPI0012B7DBF6|nr:ATP-dependent Clp protease proteolytic subunit [Piscirickettsia salmonis]QGO25448.1 Clp protease [Piscirickettsia salmonis]
MNNWYQIKAQANKHADVYIYDYIGDYGVEAKRFVMELQALDVEQINLRINSPGGSVTDGFAIYNALHRHPAKIIAHRKRRYLGRYFAHPMMQNRRAKRDDYKPSAVRVTQRCVP